MVTRITQRVLASGGRLLHGAHPTFVPLIEAAARSTPRPPGAPARPVELYVVVPFLQEYQYREFFEQKRHDDYAIVHAFGTRDSDRTATLAQMREALIENCDVLVCLGGESHVTGKRPPGVLVEMQLARRRNIPVVLAGGAGGETRMIMERAANISSPVEFFSPRGVAEGVRLVPDAGPAAATSRIMDELKDVRSSVPAVRLDEILQEFANAEAEVQQQLDAAIEEASRTELTQQLDSLRESRLRVARPCEPGGDDV
jgi:hypothetical protein